MLINIQLNHSDLIKKSEDTHILAMMQEMKDRLHKAYPEIPNRCIKVSVVLGIKQSVYQVSNDNEFHNVIDIIRDVWENGNWRTK